MAEGELRVEFEADPLVAGPGEAILIAAGECHRAAVPEGCLLLSVEAVGMGGPTAESAVLVCREAWGPCPSRPLPAGRDMC